MPALAEMFGQSPRAKLVEGLLRLGPTSFTRGELARESGVFRTTANRVFSQLETDGLIQRVTEGKHPLYQASPGSAELELLSYVASVLEFMANNRRNRDVAIAALAVAKSEVMRTVHTLSGTALTAPFAPLVHPVQGKTVVIPGEALTSIVGGNALT